MGEITTSEGGILYSPTGKKQIPMPGKKNKGINAAKGAIPVPKHMQKARKITKTTKKMT